MILDVIGTAAVGRWQRQHIEFMPPGSVFRHRSFSSARGIESSKKGARSATRPAAPGHWLCSPLYYFSSFTFYVFDHQSSIASHSLQCRFLGLLVKGNIRNSVGTTRKEKHLLFRGDCEVLWSGVMGQRNLMWTVGEPVRRLSSVTKNALILPIPRGPHIVLGASIS